MITWEYKVLNGILFYDAEAHLNSWGSRGWELVSADIYNGRYVLKKPVIPMKFPGLTSGE